MESLDSQIFFLDSATLAFQPLIDLTDTSFSNLSAQAVTHWLKLDSCSPAYWGAFMHFYGPTRKLLKMHGLNIEDTSFLNLKTSNNRWNNLLENYQSNKLNALETLYLVRLLYYLGFYEEGLQLCHKTIHKSQNLEDRLWATYLKDLGNSIATPLNWTPSNLLGVNQSKGIPILYFHFCLLISKYFIRCKKDYEQGMFWLNQIEKIIDQFDEHSNVGLLRFLKYKADALLLLEKKREAKKILDEVLNKANASFLEHKKDSLVFLFKETKRRILDALILLEVESNNFTDALKYSIEAVNTDPYCSYALAMAGKLAIKEKSNLAFLFLQNSALFGVLERSYAKFKIAEIIEDSFNKTMLDLEALKSHIDPNCCFDSSRESIKQIDLPLRIQSVQSLANSISDQALWGKVKKSTAYQRFLPFWELKKPSIEHPLLCNAPLIAFQALEENAEPWYQTIYLQRAMPIKFREELFLAVSPNTHFAQLHLPIGKSIKALESKSDRPAWLLERIKGFKNSPTHERTLIARTLGALGFYQEALEILSKPSLNNNWSFTEEYAYCTQLFLKNILCSLSNDFPYHEIEITYNKLSNQSQSLRMRLFLIILSLVFNGQRKNIDELKLWRDRGFKTLQVILENDNFCEFEKQILTSRFYRASSFYPFLINDHKTLFEEAQLCEYRARNLIPTNEKQELIKKENLFPMLESMSRIYYQLGDLSHSLNLMKEIVLYIDPWDSKAWLQVGDLHEKLGSLEEAKIAYQKACSLEVPLGGIAWYRLGRLSEKMGDIETAKSCFWRSTYCYPKGISPLKRLKELTNDHYIHQWCEKNLLSLEKISTKSF